MAAPDLTTTRERILTATLDVLARSGARKLSLSDVADAAGISRPTLYRWFPAKAELLEAFGRWEQDKYDAGIAAAVAGREGRARLETVLRFIVEFQHAYPLRRLVAVEPEHVLHQMTRVLPIMRERLAAHFSGRSGTAVASAVTRIALCHALMPDDDPELFYAELRVAAGLPVDARSRLRHAGQHPRRSAVKKRVRR